MGSTAPSVTGSRNLLDCHDVASGPVSASPSPTHAGHDEIGIVEHRAERMAERIAQLTALVDRAGALRRDVTGNATRETRTA